MTTSRDKEQQIFDAMKRIERGERLTPEQGTRVFRRLVTEIEHEIESHHQAISDLERALARLKTYFPKQEKAQ